MRLFFRAQVVERPAQSWQSVEDSVAALAAVIVEVRLFEVFYPVMLFIDVEEYHSVLSSILQRRNSTTVPHIYASCFEFRIRLDMLVRSLARW